MLFQLRNMTWRTFSAGLFGLLVPILLVLPWLSYSELTRLASKFSECVALPSMGDYEPFLMEHGITVAVTAFLLLIAVAHFFRTSYNDKIKTRMFYYVIATQELIWTVLMAIRPSEFQSTFTVWAGCSAFFLGHYFALARGRFFNIWFYTCAVVLVLLCVYNHLIRFQLFSSVCV